MSERERMLEEAVRQLLPWVGKGLADGAYDNAMSPSAAIRALTFGERALRPANAEPLPAALEAREGGGDGK